jgi:PIN like domain
MVKVLFDHNMPPVIARALHILISPQGHEAYALRDKFDKRIEDIDYFTALGKDDGWVVISKDVANAKRAPERAAILRSGVLAFYLAPSVQRIRVTEQAATILWQWEKIVAQRATNRNGLFLIPINKGSKFESL